MTVTVITGTTGETVGTVLMMGPESMIVMVGAGMMTTMIAMTAMEIAMEIDMETTITLSILTTEPAAGARLETIMAEIGGEGIGVLLSCITVC